MKNMETGKTKPDGDNAIPQAAEQAPRRLNSRHIFEGHNQVVIEHEGQDYFLRLTRQGKLILTK